MQSLFKKEDKNAIKERIQKLTPRSVPLWGKMSVAQMLAHLQQPLLVSFGELNLSEELWVFYSGRWRRSKCCAINLSKKICPQLKNLK